MSKETELVERGLAMMLEGIKKLDHRDDWVDQESSPIGKRAHLDAVKRGLVKGYKVGRRVLVRKAELDGYIELHRVSVVTRTEADDEAKRVDEIVNAEPKRRRRTG